MKLNKAQLARAFEVTPQAIDYWLKKWLPYTPGRPGVQAIFVWDEVEDHLIRYGRFGYQDPHDVVEKAYARAVAMIDEIRQSRRI